MTEKLMATILNGVKDYNNHLPNKSYIQGIFDTLDSLGYEVSIKVNKSGRINYVSVMDKTRTEGFSTFVGL